MSDFIEVYGGAHGWASSCTCGWRAVSSITDFWAVEQQALEHMNATSHDWPTGEVL